MGWTVDSGDRSVKYNAINMDKPKKKKRKRKSKNKKRRELERKLLQNDEDLKKKIGDGQSSWNRFLSLMTPSLQLFSDCHSTKDIAVIIIVVDLSSFFIV